MRLCKIKLSPWSANKVADNRFAGVCMFFLLADGRRRAIQIGFGYDNEQPWRPWPSLKTAPNARGNDRWCLCWFGLTLHIVTSRV